MDKTESLLLMGAAEADITPNEEATYLQGALTPVKSEGVEGALFVKAIVLRQNGITIAHLAFDLVVVDSVLARKCAESISKETGIDSENVLCTTTHTHRGPFVTYSYSSSIGDVVSSSWRELVPKMAVQAVSQAIANLSLSKPSFLRSYCHGIGQYRRLAFKDSRHINVWLLNRGEDDVQCIGAAGPVDPEVITMAFEDEKGIVQAVIVSYALHANAGGGHYNYISPDYPGELTRSLRKRFGDQLICLFLPAAGGNINPTCDSQDIGEKLASSIIKGWEKRRPLDYATAPLDFVRSSVCPQLRDFTVDQTKRLVDSQWPEEFFNFFEESRKTLCEEDMSKIEAPLSAWCLGDVSIVTQPGEMFVEYGMELKRRGPFNWTIPVSYTDATLGYLITEDAWKSGGYETLIGEAGVVAPEGCRTMVEESVRMLQELYK